MSEITIRAYKHSNETATANVYIDGEFSTIAEYVDLFDMLSDEQSDRVRINIYIKSLGGNIAVPMILHQLIKQTKAFVTIHVVGTLASSGTIVPLSGCAVKLYEGAKFIVHNPFVVESLGFETDTIENVIKENIKSFMNIYEKFLTPEELRSVSDGEELFIGKDRLEELFRKRGQLIV